ncbi:MAG TPA: hypothetical protein VM260_23620 [Pirellula sp.]|nr:hypothetical protein [Pirellula sp.]
MSQSPRTKSKSIRTKSKSPPRQIELVAQLVPLRNFGGQWFVDFSDDDEQNPDLIDAAIRDLAFGDSVLSDSVPATFLVQPKRGSVSLDCSPHLPDMLQALESTIAELQGAGKRVQARLQDDKLIVELCQPSDVLALAETVCRVEGRRVGQDGSIPVRRNAGLNRNVKCNYACDRFAGAVVFAGRRLTKRM